MHRARAAFLGYLFITTIVVSSASSGFAQEPVAAPPLAVLPRPLAAGVMTVIPSEVEDRETFTGPLVMQDIVSLPGLGATPNLLPPTETLQVMAKDVTLRRDIWGLEFSFKPLRMVHVDIPQPTGEMRRQLIWYMVYKVTNRGDHRGPAAVEDRFGHKIYSVENRSREVRFFPHFVLEGHVEKSAAEIEAGGDVVERYRRKAYLDRLIPAAIPYIYQRERPGRGIKLLNSVQMTQKPIEPSVEGADNSVWGVVTWEGIDPRIDYFSIFVQGLTNAFEFEPNPAGGMTFRNKTLQLNFWRPGDWQAEHESEIRYGVPIVNDAAKQAEIYSFYNVPNRLDHRWIFR